MLFFENMDMKQETKTFYKDVEMTKKPLGIILYKGKSLFDGRKIIVVATNVFGNESVNEKTGDMIQTWILRPDIFPLLASKVGYDDTYCGDCKHRDIGSCYVNLCHEPTNIFVAYHNDRYIPYNPELLKHFENRNIRIGSFGDPAAVPIEIWDTITSNVKGWTGYTHQWSKKKTNPYLKKYCMASCDTPQEQEKAKQLGWRTFRVRLPDENLVIDEVKCPASAESGKVLTCDSCSSCMGTCSKNVKDISIIVHGADFKVKRYVEWRKKIKNKRKWKKDFKKAYEALSLVGV